jgi:glutaminase
MVRQAPYCQHVILNLSYVASIDDVCLRMLWDVSGQLDEMGVRLVFCHPGRLAKSLTGAGFDPSLIFPNEDSALESCEDALLRVVLKDHRVETHSCTLAECAVFAGCNEAEMGLLEERMGSISHAAGENIILSGADSDELFVLTSGSVEVRLRLDGNRFQRLDVFSAGMCFGELAFLDGSPRSADIVAVTPVTCRVINRGFFDEMGERQPLLKAKILNEIAVQLCERLRQANIEISALRN